MQYKKSLKEVLLEQYRLHPKMQVQDTLKLIYQNEFGGGHMAANEADSFIRLAEEYRMIKEPRGKTASPCPAFEEIGNGLCRLHLNALQSTDIDLHTVNRFFIESAASVCGSKQRFEKKLDVFRQCLLDRVLPYPIDDADIYLKNYKDMGYPPLGHSEVYRESYSPAYRIVKTKYRDFFEVFNKIDGLMKSKDLVVAAIDGNCGAGKSTLADLLSAVYDCNVFHMDHFFLPPELKTNERLNQPGGNIDYARFDREIVSGLKSGRDFQYRIYDCKKMAFGPAVLVTPKRLSIVEGVYSMHPALRDVYDLKIFLDIDEKEQLRRIQKRNGVSMQKRFLCEWIPLENRYFNELGIKEQCDLLLHG